MPKSLKHYLTSDYLEASRKMYPKQKKRRILAYVESYDDIAFWRDILSSFEDDTYYFEVTLPSNNSLSKGKKVVLTNNLGADQLGNNLIACVDSDYDFLLQGKTNISKQINDSPYVLQTYAYAIENYQCYAENLHDICVEATLNDHALVDIADFMHRYSEAIYPLFLWNIWFYRQGDNKSFSMSSFHQSINISKFDVSNPDRTINQVKENVKHRLNVLTRKFKGYQEKVDSIKDELSQLGVTPANTYLFIQGHELLENVVLRVLIPICTILRRERENEINKLAVHEQQRKNEMAGYVNSSTTVENILKKTEGYHDLFLFNWIKEDVAHFMSLLKGESTETEMKKTETDRPQVEAG